MSLLAPLGLMAFSALAVVVALYMRRSIPPPRPMPTLRFWQIAPQSMPQSRKLRRPPLSLLFLIHLIIATLLAFALSRPVAALPGRVIPVTPQHLIIVLDGSLSMAATDVEPNRFAQARERAINLLRDIEDGDAATVLVTGPRLQTLAATTAGERLLVIDELEDLPLPGGLTDLNQALTVAAGLVLPDYQPKLVVISDGATVLDPARTTTLDIPITWEPVGGSADNLAITDFTARATPDNPEQLSLFARVVSFADEPRQAVAALEADGLAVDQRELSIDPGKAAELAWVLPRGTTRALLTIASDDRLAADDRAEIDVGDFSTVEVVLVSDRAGPLAKALTAIPAVRLTVTPPDAYVASNSPADVTIFDRFVPPALPEGSVWFISPPPGPSFPSRRIDPAPQLVRVDADHPVLEGADLNGTTFPGVPIFEMPEWAEEIAGGEFGPLIYGGTDPGGRETIVWSFDVHQSSLPQRVAFPILTANAVRFLGPPTLPSSFWLGGIIPLVPATDATTIEVESPGGSVTEIPVDEQLSDALHFRGSGLPGKYQIRQISGRGDIVEDQAVTVNAGSLAESDLRPRADFGRTLTTHAEGVAAGTTESTKRLQTQSDLWPLLALIALVLLLGEWLVLARRVGRRRRQPATRSGRKGVAW